jgi:hypothetical protein
LEKYDLKRDDAMIDNIQANLKAQHGINVKESGKPGVIFVAIGSNIVDLGAPSPMSSDESRTAGKEAMGAAVGKLALHEIGHESGLEHPAKEDANRIMSRTLDVSNIDTIRAQHYTKEEKSKIETAMKKRLGVTAPAAKKK